MDNNRKKTIRRLLTGVGGIAIIWSLIIFGGIEFPFFNRYNPLYNPYIFILIGTVLVLGRTFLKDIRTTANFLDFFGQSGHVHTSYKIDFQNITPTRANYIDKDGEKKSIRHGHPFVIPNKDVWLNEYLIPDNGLASINPKKLVEKYGAQLKDIDIPLTEMTTAEITEKRPDGKDVTKTIAVPVEKGGTLKVTKEMVTSILANLSTWIDEIKALDPTVLHKEQSSEDNVDGLNLEAGYQVSEIRKGWFSGGATQKVIAFVAVGLVVGALVTLMYSIAFHLNYANIGFIQHIVRMIL